MELVSRLRRAARSDVGRSSAAIAVAIVVAKCLHVAKDLFLAYAFGLGGVIDDFIAGYTIPLAFATLLVGSVNGALVPAFVRERDIRGPEAAQRLMANSVVLATVAVAVGAALLLALRPVLLELFVPTLTAAGRDRTALQFQGLVVSFSAMVIGSPYLAVLQAERRLAAVSLMSVITTCAIMVSVVLGVRGHFGPIASGVIVGSVLEALAAAAMVARLGYSPIPRWAGLDEATRATLRQAGPLLGGFVLTAGSPLVDQAFAGRAGPAGLSLLQYGGKLTTLGLALPVGLLGLTLLPKFSTLVAAGQTREAVGLAVRITRITFLIGVPIVAVGVLVSPAVARAIYLHGAVTVADVEVITRIQQYYLLQMPFLVCTIVYGRMVLALSKSHVLLFMSVFWICQNLVLDVVFTRWFGMPGIALSTSVCYLVGFLIYIWLARGLLRDYYSSAAQR